MKHASSTVKNLVDKEAAIIQPVALEERSAKGIVADYTRLYPLLQNEVGA